MTAPPLAICIYTRTIEEWTYLLTYTCALASVLLVIFHCCSSESWVHFCITVYVFAAAESVRRRPERQGHTIPGQFVGWNYANFGAEWSATRGLWLCLDLPYQHNHSCTDRVQCYVHDPWICPSVWQRSVAVLMMLQIHQSDTPSIDAVNDGFAATAPRRVNFLI